MTKTNAMRLLEAAGIDFEVLEYPVDENDLSGESVARKTGKAHEQIFKTLVFSGEKNGFGVCCIPTCEELDLKKAAKLFGEKKVEMLHVKDLLKTTGYIRGGCSPVGMKKQFPTVIDETACLFDKIYVSAGVRGMMLGVEPQALADFVNARLADVTAVE
ncbi:MAG: Cys-tRNA(Pro) deacylase [Oscillospiraceae bacterium]|nr:Cys-tRNA(Pro) deacylase [Clostridiaceae bacterium]MDY5948296.1 Cys-tRNA(Pro) deacylase [Oscillospiraceae bacterium]